MAADDEAVAASPDGQGQLPDYGLMLASLCSLTSRLAVPLPMRADLELFRAAFPGFSFGVCRGWRGAAFEAWRDAGAGGLYAVITPDACEMWRELEASQQAAAADGAEHEMTGTAAEPEPCTLGPVRQVDQDESQGRTLPGSL